jgi:tRNA (adenine57-N1/adenine58-N1)-methyltransferase
MKFVLVRGRDHFLIDKFEGQLHTHDGVIDLSALKDLNPGDVVTTHLGKEYRILAFRPSDYFKFFKRTSTPIMPKDIGAIIAHTGVGPGDSVLDAGTGTGMLAAYLANVVKPGKVITVERRMDFAKIARKNFRMAGLDNIHLLCGDILKVYRGFKSNFDLITLDMKGDVEFIPYARDLLKPGGFVAVYNPYVEHARDVVREMEMHDFVEIECFELLRIDMEFKRIGSRPSTGVWHTGYIAFGRKGN